jgi:hypothetical protein
MININQEITLAWSPTSRKYLEALGYKYEWIKEISIPFYQLWNESHARIEIICDYCNKSFYRSNIDHIKITKKEVIHKDACKDCRQIKQNETKKYKLENDILSKNDNGYWKSKENRLKELKLYIEKYNSLKNLYSANQEGHTIWLAFKHYNHSIRDAVNELGFNINDLEFKECLPVTYSYYPAGYFNNIDNLIKEINRYIKEYGKFPTRDELQFHYNIGQKIIEKHGGINNLRKKMNYINHYQLVDDNGYKNRSSYEFITAQFLIHNNTYYLRDQYPFSNAEKSYQSDFMFNINDKIYHCEIWGFADNSLRDYEENKKEKLRLYKKYKINLISIDGKIFRDSYENIQEKLKIIFKSILNKALYVVPQKHFITVDLTDDELFAQIMKYSNNKNYLPSDKILRKNHVDSLYREVIKRFGSYNDFARKYNLKIKQKERGYWNNDNLVKESFELLNKGIALDFGILRELGKNSLVFYIQKTGSSINFRLNILSLFDGILPDKEVKFLNNVINNRGTTIMNKVNLNQQQQAQQILDQYNTKINKSA